MEHSADNPAAGDSTRYVAAPDAPSSAAAATAPASAAAPAAPASSPSGFAALARVARGTLAAAYADLCAGAWPAGPEQLPVVYHPSVSACVCV